MTGEVWQQIGECLRNLPSYLGQHVLISALALGIGIVVSLPLAILGARSKALRWPVLTAASVIQTIPSMALLALFFPILVGVSYVTNRLVGVSISALGFLPTIIALTLYSMLPVLRNTVTAITGVDPAMTEAARGLGMRPRQVLLKVELPLALPVIIAGVRTATVWVVGIATLSAPIGQTSLGTYIFSGLYMENWIAVLFGCVFAAALALVLDQLIGLMQTGVDLRSTPRVAGAAVGLGVVILGGLALPALQGEGLFRGWFREETAEGPAEATRETYAIGSKTFAEQYVLAAAIRDQLEDAGLGTRMREGLGSAVIFRALASGEIDVYVDYSGTVWVNHMKRDTVADPQTVLTEMTWWLARHKGIRCLGPLGFENAYALAMKRDRAEALGVHSIDDLAGVSADLKIGGSYEFFGRPEWTRLRDAYGLAFAERKQYQATFMYKAVATGEVDVIAAFTSDGRIAAYDLVVLDDPKRIIPPYDAVLLLAPGVAEDEALARALQPLVRAISVQVMRRANYQVMRDEDGRTADQAAAWLRREIGVAEE
jgi:osmoprotectant transport system permease protein